MFIAKGFYFTYTATAIFSSDKGLRKNHGVLMLFLGVRIPPESFAGLHNQGNRILVLFDEASAIDDVIWGSN